jgi:hypothetical protein
MRRDHQPIGAHEVRPETKPTAPVTGDGLGVSLDDHSPRRLDECPNRPVIELGDEI